MDKQRLEARRAFNEALRARMRLVATEHNISEGGMKSLGRLRHYDLVNFAQKHKLCWTWVFGGDDLQGQPRRVAALSTSARQRMARWSPRVIGACLMKRRRSIRKRNRQRLAAQARGLKR
jgi:hypothetical protein